ncbi:MAG: hypothetical protein NXH90_13025 [Flavobacteriaceae bacterium]|nr:hypothetical protein [Flavobacteriaceae bacterium]
MDVYLSSEFDEKIIDVYEEKGNVYLLLTNKHNRYKLENSRNYEYKPVLLSKFLKENDRVVKKQCSDTIEGFPIFEAIHFYTHKLDFGLLEDTKIDEFKRWVVVASSGAKECSLLLAKAANEKQLASVGNQTGGRVGFFLFTDDFERDYDKLVNRGGNICKTSQKGILWHSSSISRPLW